jgi:hypothetical protein
MVFPAAEQASDQELTVDFTAEQNKKSWFRFQKKQDRPRLSKNKSSAAQANQWRKLTLAQYTSYEKKRRRLSGRTRNSKILPPYKLNEHSTSEIDRDPATDGGSCSEQGSLKQNRTAISSEIKKRNNEWHKPEANTTSP